MWNAFVILLVLIMVLAGILVAGMFGAILAVRHTNDRAGTVHSSIRPGMNARQVHEALSGPYICSYAIWRDGRAIDTDQEAFIDAMERERTAGTMRIHTMGSTPYRASFTVTFGSGGAVSAKSAPRGWD